MCHSNIFVSEVFIFLYSQNMWHRKQWDKNMSLDSRDQLVNYLCFSIFLLPNLAEGWSTAAYFPVSTCADLISYLTFLFAFISILTTAYVLWGRNELLSRVNNSIEIEIWIQLCTKFFLLFSYPFLYLLIDRKFAKLLKKQKNYFSNVSSITSPPT